MHAFPTIHPRPVHQCATCSILSLEHMFVVIVRESDFRTRWRRVLALMHAEVRIAQCHSLLPFTQDRALWLARACTACAICPAHAVPPIVRAPHTRPHVRCMACRYGVLDVPDTVSSTKFIDELFPKEVTAPLTDSNVPARTTHPHQCCCMHHSPMSLHTPLTHTNVAACTTHPHQCRCMRHLPTPMSLHTYTTRPHTSIHRCREGLSPRSTSARASGASQSTSSYLRGSAR
jgi:hypothetical protein